MNPNATFRLIIIYNKKEMVVDCLLVMVPCVGHDGDLVIFFCNEILTFAILVINC